MRIGPIAAALGLLVPLAAPASDTSDPRCAGGIHRAARHFGPTAPTMEGRSAKAVEGLPVHPGVYVGPARVVDSPSDFDRIKQGDVLVARNTGPAFNVILPLLGAIVTDRGGQLSHAAIVAREYGIPSVVGTKAATTTFPDGAMIRVDGETGRVELVS